MANTVDIVIKARDEASKNLKKAQGSLQKFSQSAKLAGAALTGVGVVGVAAFKKLASAAIEQQAMERSLRAAVENTGVSYDAVKDKINATTAALQKKTNFGDEEQMQALTLMTGITGDYEKALAALPLVMDAAATKGRGMKMIAGTLTRALDGQTDVADSLGIMFEKNTTFSERLAVGLQAVGGVAEAQADPFKQLGNDLGDVAQQFGAVLLPIITPVITKIREWMVALQNADPSVVKFVMGVTGLGIAIAAIAGPILLIVGFLPMLAAGFGIVGGAVAALGGIFAVLAGATGIGLVVAAVVGLGLAWKNNWGGIREKTKIILDFLFRIYKSKLGWILPAGPLIKGLLFIKDNWISIWDGLRRFTASILSGIANAFRAFVNRAIQYLNNMIKAFNLINPFADIPTIQEMGASAGGMLQNMASTAVDHAQFFAKAGTDKADYSGSGAQDDSALPQASTQMQKVDVYLDGKKVSDVQGDNVRTASQTAG
jgi:hypothetical protein